MGNDAREARGGDVMGTVPLLERGGCEPTQSSNKRPSFHTTRGRKRRMQSTSARGEC